MYIGKLYRQEGGFTISQQDGQWNTQTGHLEPKTLLHKRYLILRTLGQGGMGAVYQAKDMKSQTICAIKEMSLSMVPPQERVQAIQNFKVEAKMLWRLNHVNLPAFTGLFSEGSRYFMVMEYIDGSTLEDLLEHNGAPFPERRVLGWARQLCDVLEYLHSQNPPIIFRDMKPGNVMLTRDGRIKLIDFGIARFFRSTSPQDTQLLGTPGFAPPEQYGKAQTDVRSDIYSLAMTLFQLLTNTLSETGFGLKSVRAINPQISPTVARALEKAASLSPDDRYPDIASLRRALLGAGTFIFENGEQATTVQELAILCARYPDAASEYLASGEIESWLREIGNLDLAKAARHIRSLVDNPQEAVEQFLRVVMGPAARIASHTAPSARSSQTGSVRPAAQPGSRVPLGRRKSDSSLVVSPRVLDFGEVYDDISTPLSITIMQDQGMRVSGTVHATEPWILVDQVQFDGASTQVNVRINGRQLHTSTHYSGIILISPDEEYTKRDIVVTVEADIVRYAPQQVNSWRRAKTVEADVDAEDDDALTMGNLAFSILDQPQAQMLAEESPTISTAQDHEYKIKYGRPTSNGSLSAGWDPLQTSPRQRVWRQRGLTFAAAFMVASLFYTLVSQLALRAHASSLPPNPWFILTQASIILAATLGALVVRWDSNWSLNDAIDRACTSMAGVLLVLAATRLLWQGLLHIDLAWLQLAVLLVVASSTATVTTHRVISDRIIDAVIWLLKRARLFTIALAGVAGTLLGYLLTLGISLGWFTVLGILVGSSIGVLLLLRLDYLLQEYQS
jgi:serine/threonine protein kinase